MPVRWPHLKSLLYENLLNKFDRYKAFIFVLCYRHVIKKGKVNYCLFLFTRMFFSLWTWIYLPSDYCNIELIIANEIIKVSRHDCLYSDNNTLFVVHSMIHAHNRSTLIRKTLHVLSMCEEYQWPYSTVVRTVTVSFDCIIFYIRVF